MTLNNYTDVEEKELEETFTQKGWTYVIGREIGEQGTPHLQVYIEHKNAIAFNYLRKIAPRAHIIKAKGNKAQNLTYCSKEGDFQTNIKVRKPIRDPLAGKELRSFQQEIMDIVKNEPDERKIYWYWDSEGNIGKTALAKSLCIQRPGEVLFCGGKGNDIKYGVKSFLDNEENDLQICIFHFTRSVEDFVSYEALESIKDGIFFNGKYESGMCVFNAPHIICFANFPPKEEKLSHDRWAIVEIGSC